jgi:hypothetical protein
MRPTTSPAEMVNDVYFAAFSRAPAPAEESEAVEYVATAKDQRAALGDVLWVLLNSKEFLFNH